MWGEERKPETEIMSASPVESQEPVLKSAPETSLPPSTIQTNDVIRDDPEKRHIREQRPQEKALGKEKPKGALPKRKKKVSASDTKLKKSSSPKSKKKRTKTPSNMMAAKNFKVKLTDINLPNVWNREKPINLGSLTTSIKHAGQIVALTVQPDPDKPGKYTLIDGRRRYMALQDLRVKDAIVSFADSSSDTDLQAKSLVANLCREGHNPMEIATVFSWLLEDKKTNKEIARYYGMSEGYVSQHLALKDLDLTVQKAITKSTISMSQARVLCKVNEEEHSRFFFKLFDRMLNGLKGQEADEKAQLYLDKYKQRQKAKAEKEDSKTKGSKKAVTTKEKKVGRPKTKMIDYNLRKADIIPPTKETALAILIGLAERRERAKSLKSKANLALMIKGAEMIMGLTE